MLLLMAVVIIGETMVIARQRHDARAMRSVGINVPVTVPDSAHPPAQLFNAEDAQKYLEGHAPEMKERILGAYLDGKLPVSARVYGGPYNRNFAQAVAVNAVSGASAINEVDCGFYGEPCEIIVGDRYDARGTAKIYTGIIASEGYTPEKFLDEDTVLLRGGFGDGPCGAQWYDTMSFSTGATSTHALTLGQCFYGSYIEMTFSAGGKDFLTFDVADDQGGESLDEAKRYRITVKQGDQILRTITMPATGNDVSERLEKSLAMIKPDFEAYFKDPSILDVSIGAKSYSFKTANP